LSLQATLAAIKQPGLSCAYKFISVGDEDALLPNEAKLFEKSVISVRRQSGAARIAARWLLAEFGYASAEILRGPSFGPIWPPGIVGSLAHDAEMAVAVVGDRNRFACVGIDIEPDLPLPPEIMHLVTTESERQRLPRRLLESRLVFVMKEAVYKAVNTLDRFSFDFQDIEVDPFENQALVSNGRRVRIAFAMDCWVIALAYLETEDGAASPALRP